MSNQEKNLADILAKYLTAKATSIRQELEEIDESLSELAKIVLGEEPETRPQYSISKIKTVQAEGPSGSYKKTINQNGNDYKLLLEDLKAHDGKITKDGLFCWLFNDKSTVGMKPSRK